MNIKCLFSGHEYSIKTPSCVMPLSYGYFHTGYDCRCDRCGKEAPFDISESEEVPILLPISK